MSEKLFSFNGALSRRDYIAIALIGVLVKHVLDVVVATQMFHHAWTPLNYLIPLGIPLDQASTSDRAFLAVMLALSIPFAWVGMAITVKRFRAIGWPPWTVLFFFVPIANIVSFAVAAAWPERNTRPEDATPDWLSRLVPVDALGSATLALVATAIAGVVCVALATRVLGSYGWGLFAAIPFAQGALSAFLLGVHGRRSLGACVLVSLLSIVLTSAALLAVALEGAICIAMATPIAAAFAIIGALFGYALQSRSRNGRASLASVLVFVLIAPGIMGAEAAIERDAPTYRVISSVIIDAPPSAVWRHVIQFPDLPAPTELVFRLGVAYPERAHIAGVGVGAVRYCGFSTGDFVEPIRAWEPGRRLAFSVVRSAPPMRELSPYPNLDTAHLHGFMVSRDGEFRLEPLAGGRTILIGTTWYQHHLWPASYWTVFSDAIVHQIHLRVLMHIKHLSEQSSQPQTRIFTHQA